MLENIWNVICKDVITDQQTNSVSYLNCLEEVILPKIPLALPSFNIGTLWQNKSDAPEIIKVKIDIKTPSGNRKTLLETDDINFLKKRHRINFLFPGIEATEYGLHEFYIGLFYDGEWTDHKVIPLYVSQPK